MNKILKSVSMIAFVAAIAIGATSSYFSDTEKSEGNTFTAGTIDIAVDGSNPWVGTPWTNVLDKPSQTSYMTFEIENVGVNPAHVWKRIIVTEEDGGEVNAAGCGVASSEPEYTEGGGTFNADGECTGTYVPRDNLSSYMVYDMSICKYESGENNCTTEINIDGEEVPVSNTGWEVVIDEDNEVRVDSVSGIWVKLNEALQPGEKMVVSQSYHLKAWTDAGEPQITNWAQGDTMKFDVELVAMQLTAPGPVGPQMATLELREKDSTTWEVIEDGAKGTLTFNTASDTFTGNFSATGLNNTTSYDLIYYADPWPGSNPGALIATFTTDGSGDILAINIDINLGMDLPQSSDANYPAGAKIQLVLSNDYDSTNKKLTAWNPSEYLFEMNLISYEDTNN